MSLSMDFPTEPLFGRLLELSPFSERDLALLIITAPNRYKNHYIEKRHGRGRRLISQPTAEVKLLQRLLIEHELSGLPIHRAATAYRKKRSILDHATPHASARYLLKLDFKDFFPSLTERTLRYRLSLDTHYSDNEMGTYHDVGNNIRRWRVPLNCLEYDPGNLSHTRPG